MIVGTHQQGICETLVKTDVPMNVQIHTNKHCNQRRYNQVTLDSADFFCEIQGVTLIYH